MDLKFCMVVDLDNPKMMKTMMMMNMMRMRMIIMITIKYQSIKTVIIVAQSVFKLQLPHLATLRKSNTSDKI